MSTDLSAYGRQYVAKKPLFSFLGRKFYILGPEGNLRFFVKMKAFRLKEDITVFADESQTRPILKIKARSIMDFSSAYDVTDVATGEVVGACKREGLKSMLRDEWTIMGPEDAYIGNLQEDSMVLALVRRFVIKGWIPQTYSVNAPTGAIGKIKQRFNPFQLVYDVQMDGPNAGEMDPRLGIAQVVLMLAIEGRQR
jgi:uncharacterized protein YxjI